MFAKMSYSTSNYPYFVYGTTKSFSKSTRLRFFRITLAIQHIKEILNCALLSFFESSVFLRNYLQISFHFRS